MSDAFFQSPILNSPYEEPSRHWELDANGQPTSIVVPRRRQSALVSPISKSKKVRGRAVQADLLVGEAGQEYNPTETINGVRSAVESWRRLPESQWQVTPTTARLLRHWRSFKFANQRPFFCQIEAVETVIWLTEVAPRSSSQGRRFWTHLEAANAASNPELMRMALKLATGAGKTTVMAMMIAWQTLNAVRHPSAKRFTKGFLVVAPGITIKDRLRVLQPNDPESLGGTASSSRACAVRAFIIADTTNSSGTIVVSGASGTHTSVAVYEVFDLVDGTAPTAVASNVTNGSGDKSVSIDVAAGGGLFAFDAQYLSVSNTFSWLDPTTTTDYNTTPNLGRMAGLALPYAAAATGVSVRVNNTGATNNNNLLAVAMR